MTALQTFRFTAGSQPVKCDDNLVIKSKEMRNKLLFFIKNWNLQNIYILNQSYSLYKIVQVLLNIVS